ncbi:MAG: glycosyltransferase [Nitrospirota bacterium]
MRSNNGVPCGGGGERRPDVSIVMSVYNGERHLREAVESILGQTFTGFEFIIVDDASRDRSREIVRSYTDPRIVLLENERNQGITRSLNRALGQARGAYLSRQDADDISEPERLEVERDFLERRPEVGLVGTHAAFIDRAGRAFKVWRTPETHEEIVKGMLYGNCFCHGSVMLRRSCLDAVGHYREEFRYTQDYDLWLRVSERFATANIDRILYRMRRTPGTISRNRHEEQLDFHLLARELARERRRTGSDSLAALKGARIGEMLRTRYRLSEAAIAQFKAEMFLDKFSEALLTGDYLSAVAFWAKAFTFEPRWGTMKALVRDIYRSVAPRVKAA